MIDFFPEIERVFQFDDQHEITVKKLTFGELAAASGAATAKANGIDSSAYIFLRQEIAYRAIIKWRGPALDAMPCNAKSIGKLSPEIGAKMADLAWEFNTDDDGEEEKKESGVSTNAG